MILNREIVNWKTLFNLVLLVINPDITSGDEDTQKLMQATQWILRQNRELYVWAIDPSRYAQIIDTTLNPIRMTIRREPEAMPIPIRTTIRWKKRDATPIPIIKDNDSPKKTRRDANSD
jgi:hypothetical protein